MLVGAHVSVAGGYINGLEYADDSGSRVHPDLREEPSAVARAGR